MKQILVIRFSALGDVAMLAAVLKGLMSNPNISVTMLSQQRFAPLFAELNGDFHFYGADLKGRHKGIKGLNTLLQDIDYKRFDTIIDCHNVLRSRYLDLRFRLAGKQVTIMSKDRLAKWWLTCRWNKDKKPLLPMPERYSRTLSSAGHRRDLVETSSNEAPRKGIGIAPFAAHKGKIYPVERMEAVVAALSKKNEPIYLFGGGPKEVQILEGWASKYPYTICVAGKMSLAEELELIKRLRLMITMDSGNMHLASLVGTRVVSIWGATHPKAGFLGVGQKEEDCLQRDLPCRPCSIYGNKPCRFGDYRCLDISPEEVLKKIDYTS